MEQECYSAALFADAEEFMDSLDSLLAEVEVRRCITVNIARAVLGSRPALAAQGDVDLTYFAFALLQVKNVNAVPPLPR